MNTEFLYSVVFELHTRGADTIPTIQRRHPHALFLNLLRQFDPTLSARLHDEPGFRPFTTAFLRKPVCSHGEALERPQTCYLRVTLLDGGFLWHRLTSYFLEAGPIVVSLHGIELQLMRLFSTPGLDPTGWASTTSWRALTMLSPHHSLQVHFLSPTAFSLGNRQFALFPEPLLLWESLLRVWNRYAPEYCKIEKHVLHNSVTKSVTLTHADLHTGTWPFDRYVQKGFLGSCRYRVEASEKDAQCLITLAAFAHYACIGYKSTMGMGQVRVALGIEVQEGDEIQAPEYVPL